MSQASLPSSALRAFLADSRRRVLTTMLAGQGCRAIFWAAIWAAPFVAARALLHLNDLFLATLLTVVAATLACLFAAQVRLRLRQVLGHLSLAVVDQDQLESAAEFMTESDPFKRLAVKQAEVLVDEQRVEISPKQRWPRQANYAIPSLIALLIIWWLTPSWLNTFVGATSSNVNPLPTTRTTSSSTQQSSAGASGTDSPSGTSGSNGRSSSGSGSSRAGQIGSGAGSNGSSGAPSDSLGHRGTLPDGHPGKGSGSPRNSNSAQTNTPPQARASGNGKQTAGSGRKPDASQLKQQPPKPPIQRPSKDVAVPKRPSSGGREIQTKGEMDDANSSPKPVGNPADVGASQIDSDVEMSNIDDLPPERRALVLEYFRRMREADGSSAAATTQPSDNGASKP